MVPERRERRDWVRATVLEVMCKATGLIVVDKKTELLLQEELPTFALQFIGAF